MTETVGTADTKVVQPLNLVVVRCPCLHARPYPPRQQTVGYRKQSHGRTHNLLISALILLSNAAFLSYGDPRRWPIRGPGPSDVARRQAVLCVLVD